METTLDIASKAEGKLTPEGKKTIIAAWLAFSVDMYDVYLPIIALAPAMIYFTPAGLRSSIATTIFYTTLAITLVGRAAGAFIFGHFGDKIGRRKTSLISMVGFGIVTLMMALLPGYASVGLVAVTALLFLRFLGGIFLGGEYTAANPLAMEFTPKSKRGILGAFVSSAYAVGNIIITIVTSIVLYFVPSKGADSPYVQWGWRIPFLVGFVLSMGVFLYFLKYIPESRLWIEGKKAKAPLKELFSGENLHKFLQVFVVMSGMWFIVNSTAGTMPGILIHQLGIDAKVVTNGLMGINVAVWVGWLSAGILGQRFGRKTVLIWGGASACTISPLLFYLLVSGYLKDTTQLLLLALVVEVLVLSFFSITLPYITERFSTSIRASGYGLGLSLSIIIPSFYQFYMLGLEYLMPYKYTQIVLLVFGGIFIVIGAACGPETKDADFAKV